MRCDLALLLLLLLLGRLFKGKAVEGSSLGADCGGGNAI